MAEETQIPNRKQIRTVMSANSSAGSHAPTCKVKPTSGSSSILSKISSKKPETTEQDQETLPKYGEECQNVLSRSVVYPMSSIQRFPVPDEMVSWQVAFIVYFHFSLAH